MLPQHMCKNNNATTHLDIISITLPRETTTFLCRKRRKKRKTVESQPSCSWGFNMRSHRANLHCRQHKVPIFHGRTCQTANCDVYHRFDGAKMTPFYMAIKTMNTNDSWFRYAACRIFSHRMSAVESCSKTSGSSSSGRPILTRSVAELTATIVAAAEVLTVL